MFLAALALCSALGTPAQQAPANPPPAAPAAGSGSAGSQTKSAPVPRGKKLYLKDGTFQLIREYQVEGDRVRYYSLDSGQWEEIPASLVDWDATKKEAEQEQQQTAAIIKKAQKEEVEQNAEPLDIDASIQIAPTVFLPDGAGLFLFDGKTIQRMAQIDTQGDLNKGKFIEKVLVPIPIVPTRSDIYVPGARAKFRTAAGEPEFYLRTTQPDQPEIDLVRTKVEKGKRRIEHLDQFAGERSATRDSIPIHLMQMSDGVFRVIVEKDLPPGEYAVLEVLRGAVGETAENRGELNLYVWDFGVDSAAPRGPSAKP